MRFNDRRRQGRLRGSVRLILIIATCRNPSCGSFGVRRTVVRLVPTGRGFSVSAQRRGRGGSATWVGVISARMRVQRTTAPRDCRRGSLGTLRSERRLLGRVRRIDVLTAALCGQPSFEFINTRFGTNIRGGRQRSGSVFRVTVV